MTNWQNSTRLTVARSDVYWYCGGGALRNYLPANWHGTCTILSLIIPIKVIETNVSELTQIDYGVVNGETRLWRTKRDDNSQFDLFKGSPAYIDSIGVPKGVPNEYKLVNPVAAGFESLVWWVTINKNVARINYVHFNIQRLYNMTRDALQGAHVQLAAPSLMTYQNRLALDFLLAEKGGVCYMFGQDCCTFIPNNTAPDGSFT